MNASTLATVIGGVVVAVVVGMVGLVTMATAASTAQQAALTALTNAQCQGTGTLTSLTAAQSANAETIVSVTAAATGESGGAEQIALMTALAESGLHNDGPRSGNGGSLGLFQQRASQGWGTAAQELNPATATAMFVQHLLQVPQWQTMRPWLAAQAVQRSAFSKGSNYQRTWANAGTVLAQVTGSMTAAGCGAGPAGGMVGPASSYGLPVGYTIPPGTPAPARLAVAYAISKLGSAYVWAGAGPTSFDCSGLTMMAWRQGGVTLDHYTVSQMHEGGQVAASGVAAGDLVLIPGSDSPGPGLPGHVGIYLGYGLVEGADDPQVGTIVTSWSAFTAGGLDAVVDPAA